MLPISIPLAVALYITIWFTVLFAVLPFGVRSQVEGDAFTPGTDPGAPVAARLGLKAVWTTVLSAVVFVLFCLYVRMFA